MNYLVVSSYEGDLSEQFAQIIGLVNSLDKKVIECKIEKVIGYKAELKEVEPKTDLEFGTTKPIKCYMNTNSYNDECYYLVDLGGN